MMRLQRVGRKNDPSYRIVVTDKRTGPKSNKHVALLGSYNPKMNHIQLDADAAKEWLSKGVQPSDTMHNILVSQKVIDAKKINVLPKKSPIVSEEAEEEKKEEASAESSDTEEAPEEPAEETPKAEEEAEDTKEEAEAPTEDGKEEEKKEA